MEQNHGVPIALQHHLLAQTFDLTLRPFAEPESGIAIFQLRRFCRSHFVATGDGVFRHLAPDFDVDEGEVIGLVEALDPAAVEKNECERLVVGIDITARQRFLADEERLGELTDHIQIGLRCSQFRADLSGRYEQMGREAIGLRLDPRMPVLGFGILPLEITMRTGKAAAAG